MVNKKGFVKTLEAIIAVIALIVFVFSIAAISIKTSEEPPGNVVDAQDFIFKSILNREDLRGAVLGDDRETISGLVEDTKPLGYGYEIQFCSVQSCEFPSGLPDDKTVYVSSVYVVNTVNKDDSKILKVFLWEE